MQERDEEQSASVRTKRKPGAKGESKTMRTEVRDGCVLGLTRSVGDHDTPSIRLSELSTGDENNKISIFLGETRKT